MRLFRRDKQEAADAPVTDEWQVSDGTYNGRRIIATFRTGARHLVGSPRYGIQIGVAVPLLAGDAEGMPGPDELAQLMAFEDAVSAHAGDKAVLVGVITTGGMREFVLYTGTGEWIASFHESLKAALPSHEIQVMARTDPKWAVYGQFVPR
jgi:hypothetical protein